MVAIRPAVPKSESAEFLLFFARALADWIMHVNPIVQRPNPKQPRALRLDVVKMQCGMTCRSLTLETSD